MSKISRENKKKAIQQQLSLGKLKDNIGAADKQGSGKRVNYET